MFNDYGQDYTKNTIETLQYITKEFLLLKGFSVGISDVIPSDNLRKAKKKIKDCRNYLDANAKCIFHIFRENLF